MSGQDSKLRTVKVCEPCFQKLSGSDSGSSSLSDAKTEEPTSKDTVNLLNRSDSTDSSLSSEETLTSRSDEDHAPRLKRIVKKKSRVSMGRGWVATSLLEDLEPETISQRSKRRLTKERHSWKWQNNGSLCSYVMSDP